MLGFKTSLPQIEMSRKLLVNAEKDFSDRRYDIRIFEVTVKHAGSNVKKYQLEMFAVDDGHNNDPEDVPKVIFRCDFLSQAQQQGKKLMVERFNII